MTTAADPAQPLKAAVAALQSQRAVLGDARVDAAVSHLLDCLAALSEPASAHEPAEASRRLRQVSVLFLDLVGSTQLIQRLDPEEVQAVVDGALAAFTAIVHQHGGEVLRYAGDNLKVSFGAHDTAGTREDDAERAVHCGLALLAEAARRGDEIKRQHGHEGFNARVGIHTGGVVRGGGVENEKSLSGLTVNVAARLEQAAPAGGLRISQDTWALVRGLFDAQAQPPLAVKGVDGAIASWLVQGPKPRAFRLHARGIRGHETPFVGREAELACFDTALHTLLADRQPRVLTVIAEAGLGKSRLLQEFQHILSARPTTWWLMLARSQLSGALQPYGLLRDLLARRLEIADSDPAEVARGKLVQGLSPWLGQPNDPAPELLGHLIGLDFSATPAVQRLGGDARLLRDRALTALRLWLQRLAASDGSPVVLLLDDLHWADDASLDALVTLLKAAAAEPSNALLALLCARPGLIERVPGWGEGLPQHERLTLEPLDAVHRGALTRLLLQRLTPVPAELADLVERRAEGNPFYAEELVGMLLDRGVITAYDDDEAATGGGGHGAWRFHPERLDPQGLPTTLTGVLQARLDALDPDARRALQMASVIGPVFWDDALGALDKRGPEALPALQRKSLVQRRPTSAFDNTVEEAFQHHLLHQVSYDTVLKPQKREAHARAAAWLTERVGDRSDEYPGITAEHYARAGEPAPAADWFLRAAKAAETRWAYKLSLQHLDHADAQAAMLTGRVQAERRAGILNQRIHALDSLALREQQEETVDALLALGESHGDERWTAQALSARSLLAYRTGRLALSEAAGRRGAELAERIDDVINAALCRGNLAWMAIESRAFDVAREELAAALRWARLAGQRRASLVDTLIEAQVLLVEVELHIAQDDDEAIGAALSQVQALMPNLHAPRLECFCVGALATRARRRGELTQAASHVDTMLRLAADFGLAHQTCIAQQTGARVDLQAGRWDAAAGAAATAAVGFGALGDVITALKCRELQAEALWRSGQAGAAVAVWLETAATLQQRGDEVGARALRLRLADAQACSAQAEDVAAACQAVLAELPALQAPDALASAGCPLAARLAGWRVLRRARHPAAAGQLALAGVELDKVLNGIKDPEVRERVRDTVPWHRDVIEALAAADQARASDSS